MWDLLKGMAFIFYDTLASKWEAIPPPHLAPTIIANKVSELNHGHLPILADAASIADGAIGSLPQVTTFLCHISNVVFLFHFPRMTTITTTMTMTTTPMPMPTRRKTKTTKRTKTTTNTTRMTTMTRRTQMTKTRRTQMTRTQTTMMTRTLTTLATMMLLQIWSVSAPN